MATNEEQEPASVHIDLVELEAIRAELDVLVERRLSADFTFGEQRRYEELAAREHELLGTVRASSTTATRA